MFKKGIVSGLLFASLVFIVVKLINNDKKDSQPVIEQKQIDKSKDKESKKKIEVGELHFEILRLIASGSTYVYDISPEDADKELSIRVGQELDVDKKVPNFKDVPVEILKLIAKSSATIAGISPKTAIKELAIRYLSIDSLDLNSAVLLEALQHKKEKENIDKWADNEDAEAVEAFMKEEADRDPSSVANLAYGLRHLYDKHEEAMTYMQRYADNAHGDAFDNKDEDESHKILIEAIKKLK